MLNKVHLIGHLGKDPVVKDLDKTKLVTISLCTNEYYKNKQGEQETKSEWHNLVLWGIQAEIAEKYFRKGKLVYIEGKITTRSYTVNEEKKYTTEIVVKNFHILTKREQREEEMGNNEKPNDNMGNNLEKKEYNTPTQKTSQNEDDDLPF